MKKGNILFILFSVVVLFVSPLFAIDILNPGQNIPKQVILIRQFVMQAMGAGAGEIRKKLESGDINGISVNAKSIAALSIFLPILYSETYKSEYPIPGKKYYFKEAPLNDIETMSRNLLKQAEELIIISNSNDSSVMKTQISKLMGSCAACHKATRGEY